MNLFILVAFAVVLVVVGVRLRASSATSAPVSVPVEEIKRRNRKIVGIVLLVLGLVGIAVALFVHTGIQDTNAAIQASPELQLRLALDSRAQAALNEGFGTALAVKYGAGGVGAVFALIGLVILLTTPAKVIYVDRRA